MPNRIDYTTLSAPLFEKFLAFAMSLPVGSSIEQPLLDLVNIRVSQLNSCAFCVDMHVKEAKIHGERELRIHHLTIWRESDLFSPRERAALALAETMTNLPDGGVTDEVLAAVREELTEQEVSDLMYSVVAINGWNRFNAVARATPGSLDEMYGLTKAGLS
ncbi:MAG: carboxymuconolactone decarboxylase family protein [Phycisphaerales bacterium]